MLGITRRFQHYLVFGFISLALLFTTSTKILTQTDAAGYFSYGTSSTAPGTERFIQEHSLPRLAEQADFAGLRKLCKDTKWKQNVYFTCTHNLGGLMNVRNMVLNCVRYSIAAGASGLILPQLEARDPTDLEKQHSGEYKPMSFLFDEVWFKELMQSNCPQMTLFDKIEDVPNFGYAMMPNLLNIQKIMEQPPGNRHGLLRNKNPGKFRSRFDELIANQTSKPTERVPVIVRLDDKALFSFPPSFDPPAIMNNFGFILEFRLDLSGLANVITKRLHQPPGGTGERVEYVGLHLRSEPDKGRSWATFNDLANGSLSAAADNHVKTIYVASGDVQGVAKLTAKGKEKGVKVVDKWAVLTNVEKEYLKPFRFDQQAIVDYLVLMRSGWFVGSGQSSFSSHLLLRRELLTNISPAGEKFSGGPQRDQLVGLGGRLGYWDMDWP